jgi:hypothetical protein
MEGKDSAEGGSATVGGDLRKVYVATDEIVALKYLSSRGNDLQQTVPKVFFSISKSRGFDGSVLWLSANWGDDDGEYL